MVLKTSQQQIIGLVFWLVLCFVASAIGAIASIQAQSFYGSLVQPSWAPPAWLFGPVWTALYTMMAISAWMIWRYGGFAPNRKALSLFVIQLALNSLWSWLFFAWLQGMLSFINIVFLWVFILLTLIAFWRKNTWAGLLLVPYIIWVSFASALNFAMWQLNPTVLG